MKHFGYGKNLIVFKTLLEENDDFNKFILLNLTTDRPTEIGHVKVTKSYFNVFFTFKKG